METNNNTNNEIQTGRNERRDSGRYMGGAVLIIIGGILLAKKAGLDFPEWFFTWPMLVIAIGVFSGAKSGFRDWGWLIPVAVGAVFLVNYNLEGFSFNQYWPVIVIAVGLSMILNAATKKNRNRSC